MISQLTQQFKTWSPEQQTRAGLAAYDAGPDKIRVKSKLTPKEISNWCSDAIDKETTNGDFSADIYARAKYIETFLYWPEIISQSHNKNNFLVFVNLFCQNLQLILKHVWNIVSEKKLNERMYIRSSSVSEVRLKKTVKWSDIAWVFLWDYFCKCEF